MQNLITSIFYFKMFRFIFYAMLYDKIYIFKWCCLNFHHVWHLKLQMYNYYFYFVKLSSNVHFWNLNSWQTGLKMSQLKRNNFSWIQKLFYLKFFSFLACCVCPFQVRGFHLHTDINGLHIEQPVKVITYIFIHIQIHQV